MPKNKSHSYVDRITQLLKDRDLHAQAMNTAASALRRIDGVLSQINSVLGTKLKGAAAAAEASGRRTRQTFAVSGEKAILDFVKKKGSPTSQEIQKFWKSQGRGGSAANALVKLTKSKQLKRTKAKTGRGSHYSLG